MSEEAWRAFGLVKCGAACAGLSGPASVGRNPAWVMNSYGVRGTQGLPSVCRL